jgi:hypothetical protein
MRTVLAPALALASEEIGTRAPLDRWGRLQHRMLDCSWL